MKALSLTQPWATLVVIGAKRVETRSWATHYAGRIAIHASKGFPDWARDTCSESSFKEALAEDRIFGPCDLVTGAIIGTAVLMGCRFTQDVAAQLSEREIEFGDYEPGRFAWFLSDPRAVNPIPCRGALGLWTVPEEIAKVLG